VGNDAPVFAARANNDLFGAFLVDLQRRFWTLECH
jgi:hypothetical protein